MAQRKKPIVFISHITEEKEIAQALKKLVEKAFVGMMEVFISSDPASIRLGQPWLDKIVDALSNCAIEIVIVSPESVRRPWINFEAGAGWIRGVPVVPFCHSGMTPDTLPAPLGALQSATATEPNEINLIIPVLADALGSGTPDVDPSELVEVVKNYENTSKLNASVVAHLQGEPIGDLAPHEIATLVAIVEKLVSPNDAAELYEIKSLFLNSDSTISVFEFNLALKMLERKEYIALTTVEVEGRFQTHDAPAVMITDTGWLWMEKNRSKILSSHSPSYPSKQKTHQAPAEDEVPF